MTGKRIITKLTTILLILVFSQKMGVGLYLHNWLHASIQHATSSKPVSGQEIQFACGCINDFNLPFTETIVPSIEVPVTIVEQSHIIPVFTIPAVFKHFHSLRGPPVVTA
ncbi:hypothetical protein A4H97_27925 [Niastella yeongjuensis]|uniref:Uncharacterized protein n=1 Tax=Niastella yeongjuensis TaxID=354355 RepID=A0A1V9EUZ4_9BACT|nr:hypothetical protein [Niastella yeongjuensis]OQP49724.1 hypothetical protein A4H97_27925 [Niastella yeongjuensis]SEP40838.1 hypothetical protein SAMN05660816_05850 [Niastella yeongjuensis]